MSTLRAILTAYTRDSQRHTSDRPMLPCTKGGCELAPRRVMNALGETMVVHHPIDRQIFDSDQIKGVDDAAAVLMGEVAAPPGDALMHPRHHSCAARRAQACPSPLCSGAAAPWPAPVPRGGRSAGWRSPRPCERGEGLQSHINANLLARSLAAGAGSAHSHEKQTYHLPVLLRLIVAVLGVPSRGRCRMTLTWPTFITRRRCVSASSLQPTGTCGKVRLS